MKLTTYILCMLMPICFITNGQTIQGTYAIKNVKTGMLLRVKDANGKNGTPLVAYNPENWKCKTQLCKLSYLIPLFSAVLKLQFRVFSIFVPKLINSFAGQIKPGILSIRVVSQLFINLYD